MNIQKSFLSRLGIGCFCVGAALCGAPQAHAGAEQPVIPKPPSSQPVNQSVEPSEFVLNGAQQFTLKSQINGREYRIFVVAPQGEVPADGFPVIYTSDGNAMFPQLAATTNLLYMSHRAVIVGIGYPSGQLFDSERRYFDLTPKLSPEAMQSLGRGGRGGAARESGGNDIFIEVIEKEVKPLIESRFKIDRQKQTLFGHSLGGLFTLHVLFNRPETFQNYVAAAPSVWWNNQSILEEQKAFLEKYKTQTLNLNVLITSNTDPTRRRPTPAQVAQNGATGQTQTGQAQNRNSRQAAIENSGTIIDALKTIQGVTAEFRVFENETHVSMVPGSITSALRFVLGDSQRSQTAPPVDAARGGGGRN